MKNRHMALLLVFLVDRASAVVTIATANWHSFDVIGEVLKMEFKVRGVDTESSAKRYGSSELALQGLLAGETQVVPEAWVNIRKANGFYTLPGFTCGDVSLCNVPNSCTRPTSPNCAACEQACSGDLPCRMYSCSATEVDDTLRCQLWSAPHLPTIASETTTECALKAGWIDYQELSTGVEGIYVPNYVGATDWTTPEALSSTPLEVIIGPPVSWATSHATMAAIASKYNIQFITPPSAESHLKQILQHMKRKAKFAFYHWKPHVVSTAYEITEVTLPLNTAVSPPAPYFPFTHLQTVWRVDSLDAVKYVPKITAVRSVTDDQFTTMLDAVAAQISLTLPPTNSEYQKAIVIAARAHVCVITQRREYCVPVDKWSMEKGPDLPERALVWTRDCIGFAKCISDDGELLLRPEKGYSIDHLHMVMRMVGYKRQEYDVRCYHESDGFAGMIAKTGQERATLAHSCITITAERLLVASFSTGFYHTGLDILIKRPVEGRQDHMKELRGSLSPFELTTWIMCAVALISSALLVLFFECRLYVGTQTPQPQLAGSTSAQDATLDPSSWRQRSTSVVAMMIFEGLQETMTIVQKKHWTSLKSWVAQFLMVFNILLLVILLEFYTANLAAALVVNPRAQVIRRIEDLRGEKVATVRETATYGWLTRHHPEMHLVLCDVEKECVDFVLDGSADAFVFDDPILEYLASQDCDVMTVNAPVFFNKDFGIVFPPGSPLQGPISQAVTLLREEGVHQELQAKYFPVKECPKNQARSKIKVLTIVGLLTLVMLIFVIISIISSGLLYAERFFTKKPTQRQEPGVDEDVGGGNLRRLYTGSDHAVGGSRKENLGEESDATPETTIHINAKAQGEQSIVTIGNVLPTSPIQSEYSPSSKTAVELAASTACDFGHGEGITSMSGGLPGLAYSPISPPTKVAQHFGDERSESSAVVLQVAAQRGEP